MHASTCMHAFNLCMHIAIASLLEEFVHFYTGFSCIIQDSKNVRELLKRNNVDSEALADFAELAAVTCSGLPDPEVTMNHHNQKDVALFDFTTMHESENASKILERKGKRLLLCVAGDTLLMVYNLYSWLYNYSVYIICVTC